MYRPIAVGVVVTSNCRIRHLGVQAWFKCSLALENMVLCAMIGCSNRTERDKGKRFFRLPAVLLLNWSEYGYIMMN